MNFKINTAIFNKLKSEIDAIKSYWIQYDSPVFIKIKVRDGKYIFLANVLDISISPDERINDLFISNEQKKEMISNLDRMLPGAALILFDTDSDDINQRFREWYIV